MNFAYLLSGTVWTLAGCAASALLCREAAAVDYQWKWMKGSKTANTTETRGVQNVAAPGNTPQALARCGTLKDDSGNFYIYGGFGSTGQEENDLWKLDPVSGNWTWIWGYDGDSTANYNVLGAESPFNRPGARRNPQMWTDGSGNLWLFGGQYSTICHHDFWKFNFASGQWMWVAGDGRSGVPGNYGTKGVAAAENYPPGREGAATWTDAEGKFWMFGGQGPTNHLLNDLWKFDPLTGYWTWMSGDNVSNAGSIYGIKGVPAPENKPAGRSGSVEWKDQAGNFWIFGGQRWSGNLTEEVWKYDVALGQWAFMDGSTGGEVYGVYGTQGIPHENNTPGTLAYPSGAGDSHGNLMLFGGGVPVRLPTTAVIYRRTSDFWYYDIAAGNWTWHGGSRGMDAYGVFGTLGVADEANWPGGRMGAAAFTDAQDNLWVFGGQGRAESTSGVVNDTWKAEPTAAVAGWELY